MCVRGKGITSLTVSSFLLPSQPIPVNRKGYTYTQLTSYSQMLPLKQCIYLTNTKYCTEKTKNPPSSIHKWTFHRTKYWMIQTPQTWGATNTCIETVNCLKERGIGGLPCEQGRKWFTDHGIRFQGNTRETSDGVGGGGGGACWLFPEHVDNILMLVTENIKKIFLFLFVSCLFVLLEKFSPMSQNCPKPLQGTPNFLHLLSTMVQHRQCPLSALSVRGPQMVWECVCVCGQNELEVCTMLAYPDISSVCTMPVLYTSIHTHASSNHLRILNWRG